MENRAKEGEREERRRGGDDHNVDTVLRDCVYISSLTVDM